MSRPPTNQRAMHLNRRLRLGLHQAILLASMIALAGCSKTTLSPGDPASQPLPAEAARFIQAGSASAQSIPGTRESAFGCDLAFEQFQPSPANTDRMVFLAHGFFRDLDTMRGWAEHWASHGIPVTILSFCNSTPFNGHHERNARDMVQLADTLHDGPRIYAGFSAGGLAALIAATSDPKATGYLGLDSVDSDDLAQQLDPTSAFPSLFLFAEPSACNAHNNLLQVATTLEGSKALRIRSSTHCHYEYPYDARCEIACGAVEPQETQRLLISTVRSLATAWLLANTQDTNPAHAGEWQDLSLTPWRSRVERLDSD